MNIQAKKLWLIEHLLRIQDDVLINRLKSFMEHINREDEEIKPMSLESFYDRIERSEEDILNGRTISHDQMKKEIETWKRA